MGAVRLLQDLDVAQAALQAQEVLQVRAAPAAGGWAWQRASPRR